jgi:hypothetical protein
LIQLAESVGIECVVDYVNNREEFMKELMDAYGCTERTLKLFYYYYLRAGLTDGLKRET